MFEYDFMRTALMAGGVVAIVAGTVGYFLVLRNLTFAGHALSHVGFAGATGSVLLGIGALWGLLAFTLAAAVAMGLLGDRMRNRDVAVGLFTYPILQAADILIYQANEVPVGEDQRQHLELSRDLARRFNHRFGETFAVPGPSILPGVAKIADLQDPTAKMSKTSSAPQGILDVLDDPATLRRKIMRAVTDPGTDVRSDEEAKPGITNLLRIYSALTGISVADLEAQYAEGGYGRFKKDLAEVVVQAFAPIRERTEKLLADEAELDRLLARGAVRASGVARQTMALVRDRIGLLPLAR